MMPRWLISSMVACEGYARVVLAPNRDAAWAQVPLCNNCRKTLEAGGFVAGCGDFENWIPVTHPDSTACGAELDVCRVKLRHQRRRVSDKRRRARRWNAEASCYRATAKEATP